MNRNPGWSPFAATFSEEDIRRLCGPSAFKQGDAWQRAGHVQNAALLSNGISGEVVGTWRRVDTVRATAAGSQIRTECSCQAGEFCRHAAALLLQWLRSPTSFGPGVRAEDLIDHEDEDLPAGNETLNGVDEFAQLLTQDTMAHLRQVARARDIKVTARNKAELIEQLGVLLNSPNSIESALTGLDTDARLALAAIDLTNIFGQGSRQAIGTAYRELGGDGKMTLDAPAAADRLVDLALVMPGDRYAHPPHHYIVPAAVETALAANMRAEHTLDRLLRPVDLQQFRSGQADGSRDGTEITRSVYSPFTLIELFQVVVHALVAGAVDRQPPDIPPQETAHIPYGWRIDPEQHVTDSPANPRGPRNPQSLRRIIPLPPPIAQPGLEHLIALTGVSTGMLDFAIHLMLAMGIVTITVAGNEYRVQARDDLLHLLVTFPPAQRLVVLADTYLALSDTADLRLIVGSEGQLQLLYRPSYYASMEQFQPRGGAVRRLVTRLLTWLSDGTAESPRWYDAASLVDLLWRLSPSILGHPAPQFSEWWFATGEEPEPHLDLTVRNQWQLVMQPLITAILTGPLTWLGIVETVAGRGNSLAFRVLPAVRAFNGEEVEAAIGPPTPAPPLQFAFDREDGTVTVTVPAGSPDPAVHTVLRTIGDLQQVSSAGLRYRMSAERLQAVFEDGFTGHDIINTLANCAGGVLPDAVRQTIDDWWKAYGTIRLYDDVTLIELGDDVLLRELRATTSLERTLVHVFSPRLIAVEGAMAEDLLAEIKRLGHTPRLVESA